MKEVALPPSAQARLDEVLAEIRALKEGGSKEALLRAEALARFQRSGDLAAPMSSAHVAVVLNTSVHAVNVLVSKRKLQRRFPTYGFHPDDVRAFLEAGRNPQREVMHQFLQQNRKDAV